MNVRYKMGRKCKVCKIPISMYNPYHLCWRHAKVYCEEQGITWTDFEKEFQKMKTRNQIKVKVCKLAELIDG